jgi:hypothetical protein
MGRACSTHGRYENYIYTILVGKTEGRRPLGRRRRRWEVSIGMGRREIGREGVDWMYLAQDMDQWRAVVNKIINLRVP